MGAKKKPFYRVVVADADAPRDGRFIEQVGFYDPKKEPAVIQLDTQKVDRWLRRGAQPTEIVARLIRKTRASSTATP
jgi:small subunit ribosomal protein S16